MHLMRRVQTIMRLNEIAFDIPMANWLDGNRIAVLVVISKLKFLSFQASWDV